MYESVGLFGVALVMGVFVNFESEYLIGAGVGIFITVLVNTGLGWLKRRNKKKN